jgi:uncharacterized protein (TIGR03000 family)
MRSRIWKGGIVVLTLLALGLTASEAQAQRRGRGGRGGGWGVSVGPGGVYYGQGGRYDGWGRGYGDRGYGGYGDRWYGSRYGGGYGDPYWSGGRYVYPRTYYSSPSVVYQDSYPSTTQSYSFYSPAETTTDSSIARIRVRVGDPNAEVWFNGSPTQQRGADRVFETPPLSTSSSNTYEIRARWRDDDGQMRDRTRTINVQPGRETMVDFTRS